VSRDVIAIGHLSERFHSRLRVCAGTSEQGNRGHDGAADGAEASDRDETGTDVGNVSRSGGRH
jgi:hypothetical protein